MRLSRRAQALCGYGSDGDSGGGGGEAPAEGEAVRDPNLASPVPPSHHQDPGCRDISEPTVAVAPIVTMPY